LGPDDHQPGRGMVLADSPSPQARDSRSGTIIGAEMAQTAEAEEGN